MAAICAIPTSGLLLRKRSSGVCSPRHRRQVAVDHDFGEIGAENVGAGLDQDGNQGNPHLPLVGTQIREQPLHQAAVIRFA